MTCCKENNLGLDMSLTEGFRDFIDDDYIHSFMGAGNESEVYQKSWTQARER